MNIKEITNQINPSQWYSVQQIAKGRWLFGRDYMGVRYIVRMGEIPAAFLKPKQGKQVRYRIWGQDIINYIIDNKPSRKVDSSNPETPEVVKKWLKPRKTKAIPLPDFDHSNFIKQEDGILAYKGTKKQFLKMLKTRNIIDPLKK